MKHLSRLLLAVVVVIGLTKAGTAVAAGAFELDKFHTNFYFTVDHIYSKIRGQFNEFEGSITFDPKNLGASSFVFKIETASIDTNVAKRDKHLQSADFFDAGKYPQMLFTSKKITDKGGGRFDVLGTFTVKGVDYELILPLEFAGIKDHPAVKGKEVAGFNGRLTIDRLAYKVGDGKLFQLGVVGKDVEILVSIEAMRDKQ